MSEFKSTITNNIVSLRADNNNHNWLQTGSYKLFKQSCYDDIWDMAGKSRPLSAEKAAAISHATGSSTLYFVVPDNLTITKKLAGSSMDQYRIHTE